MKFYLKLLMFLNLFVASGSAFAENKSVAVFDVTENKSSELPRNFRDLNSVNLNAIASAQFSEKQLQEVRKKYAKDKIIIVDLRGEAHGIINGEAVSWRSIFDNSNKKESEKNLLSNLQNETDLQVNKVSMRDRKSGWYKEATPIDVKITSVADEEYLAKKNGFEYKRFLVRDFDVPNQKQFAEMINFIKTLPSDKKIYVHCAGGSGRTGMFLVLLDIFKNGQNSSLEEIFARQAKLGAAKLDEISTDEAWTKEIAAKRLKMIEKFYYSIAR